MERQRYRINRKINCRLPSTRMPPPPKVLESKILPTRAKMPSSSKRVPTSSVSIQLTRDNVNRITPPERRMPKAKNVNKHIYGYPVGNRVPSTENNLTVPQHASGSSPKDSNVIYPTLSTFYRHANLDYSPPEPTADYPYMDDLPINNLYPVLSREAPQEHTVDGSVASEVNNAIQHEDSAIEISVSPSLNLNINVPENKVLNNKNLDVCSSTPNENLSGSYPNVVNTGNTNYPSAGPGNVSPAQHYRPRTEPTHIERNSFQKKCDASKFIDENTPPIMILDPKSPIKSKPNHDAHYDINKTPKSAAEFGQWMTWRKQVNRHIASMILLKQGKEVYLSPSEVNRKPLAKSAIKTAISQARVDVNQETSLGGKPYIMYGIPRAKFSG